MFQNCSYHVLGSLVPPSPEVDKSNKQWLSSLESLCAVSIAKYGRYHGILSQTPRHLHKVIWRAYLADKYYSNNFSLGELPEHDLTFGEIPQLLYTWPYEEFVLKELMPSFPPKLESFKDISDPTVLEGPNPGPYEENKNKLRNYYSVVVDAIISTFTKESSSSISVSEQDDKYCKIRKIDISGYKIIIMNEISDIIEIEEPFLRNSSGKLEIVLDVCIMIDNIISPYIESGTNRLTTNKYSNTCNTIFLKFNHITVGAYTGKHDFFTQFIEEFFASDVGTGFFEVFLANYNGNISLDVGGINDGSCILEKFLNKIFPKDRIREVMLDCCNPSLTCLLYLNNLVHLDLQECNLHGKIDAIAHMEKGLVYLNMSACHLENSDIAHLLGSSHETTLQELNLGFNRFYQDENSSNLIELCKNLANVLYLDFECCGLDGWSINVMESLYHSFKDMPNIVVLYLCDTIPSETSIYIIKNLIMILKENLSLRYVKLAFPEDGYEIRENLIAEMNELGNVNRSQLLYIELEI